MRLLSWRSRSTRPESGSLQPKMERMLTDRRVFLAVAAGAALGCSSRIESVSSAPGMPPIRQISAGPRFHWFGYYDKQQFDPTNRYVLGMEVDFEHRSASIDRPFLPLSVKDLLG